jgi:hypothetical protein
MKIKSKKGKLNINNNVLFALALVLIAINSYTFVIASKDVITGLAGEAQGTTRICIGTLPSMSAPTPNMPVVLNDTYNSTVSATMTEVVRFYHYHFGTAETLFGTDYDVDNDTTFNATLDVPSLPDGNCNYRIIARASGFCDITDVRGSSTFTVNNVDIEPKWDEFKNGMSTNFSSYTSWTDISGARIAVPDQGMIEFITTNFDDADLDYMFNISNNLIKMNVSIQYNCFDDVEYKLNFFNVTPFAEPIVLKNGAPCGAACISPNYTYSADDTYLNFTFVTRVSTEDANFTIAEGGTLTMNYTFDNKTYDNSPTINFSTYMRGSTRNIPIAATCWYKTDYSPTGFTLATVTGGKNHSIQLPEQNWSYLPTNMGHYAQIQHHDYYSGPHMLYLNCTVGYQDRQDNTTFLIIYTDRDRVYYSDGSEVKMFLQLEEPGLNVSVDFSQIDSSFNPANVVVVNNGLDYNISYNISATNTRPDGEYNVTIEAFNSTGEETMNGSIFMHLHNNWRRSDIDDAFDCWNFKQGYYFDEVACDWESDLNHVADLVDAFTVEISCFDTIDNDLDGKTDINDTDCAGIYYLIRRAVGIDSAFLGDPCFNNVCRVCLGDADADDNGICDTAVGVNVKYLNKVRPGQTLRVKYNKAYINNQSVRVSVNYLNDSFNVQNSTSGIEQLPRKELGGCVAGQQCKSVTGTTFGPGLPDRFIGALNERMNITISPSSYIGPHPELAAGKSIEGSSAYQNMVFFDVRSNAIINESDNATYCFDGEDNDLNDQYDCFDISCNLTSNPAAPNQRCEMPHEITCNDSYDNDRDGYTDCEDNDCFQKNGTTGPCYARENFNSTSCADKVNNDFDWGYRCDATTNISYQTRQTNSSYSGTTRMTDCLDIDCNNSIGNTTLNARCEYCNEKTCNDNFDNDVDTQYDCTGNAYRNQYERDCDRWHDVLITCQTEELNCSDSYDNDLDSDSLNGGYSWLGVPVFGGWNCIDMDCDSRPGNSEGDLCQWRNETVCDDTFDNDGDGLVDCYDPVSCKGLSGSDMNLIGLCRPCANIENITIDACRDGDDNDYDGPIDCADPNCDGMPRPGLGACGLTESINCTDGIDNDYDFLIDMNDSDCSTAPIYPDELGPGQCSDGIDNDDDNRTDCSDTDCVNTMRCMIGSYNNIPTSIGYVGAVEVYTSRYVNAGKNYTTRYVRPSLNVASVVLKLGNVDYSLRNISPVIDDNNSFMTGTTTNFFKVNDTYGLKAQNTDGFSGSLNLFLISTTGASTTPGSYDLFVSTSIPGVYGTSVTDVYIAENEPPTIHNITVTVGHILTGPSTVNVTFTVNTTDNGTYNSGIAFCTMQLEGYFTLNRSTCSYTTSLGPGTYNFSAIAYDGAMNPSNLSWQNFTVTISTVPTQIGDFYNSYPAENYPDRKFFNETEKLNIGVNFEGGTGFEQNDTGCEVEIRNRTETLSTQYVNLSVVGGEAHCNGQVELSVLFNSTNSTSPFPSEVYYFTVSLYDNSSNKGTSTIEDFNFCYYYYDNSSSKYRCRDQCQLHGLLNRPPVLITDIPNQTWPRGTKLSVIDLDDYFMDPDNDPLTFTWVIDNARINVSIDSTHLVTFAPDQTFYGFAHITFYAHDFFSSTPSNVVTLEVLFTPLPQMPAIPAGGGGGGGTNFTAKMPVCEEDWICSDWGPCLPSGYQTRTCRDKNECGTNNKMPETTRECIYNPTCRDKIKNQGETGIDCGGPCPPCPSCTDRILNQKEEKTAQMMSADTNELSDCGGPFCPVCPRCDDNTQNQGETGIDCGGPCGSCATCNDGIRNQGEVNIDCGGPCPSCRVRIVETAFNWNLLLLIISSLFLLLLLLLALLFGVFKKKFIRLKAKLLNYYMRLMRMFEKKKMVERELPIMRWVNMHLDSIGGEIEPKGVEHGINQIDKLVRIFFKRVFLIRYAFTNEELVKDLEKHHIPVVLRKASELLLEELAQIKYGGETVDKEGVKTLISQVRVLAERIVNEIETKKKTKINISERDITKIGETLEGAEKLGVEEAIKKIEKKGD